MAPTKKIRVTYNAWDEFVIPSSIDLDKVYSYHVKYNKLYIHLTENGETLIIESKGFLENDDFKYPDNLTDSETDDSDYEFGDDSDEEEEPLPKYKLPPPKLKKKLPAPKLKSNRINN